MSKIGGKTILLAASALFAAGCQQGDRQESGNTVAGKGSAQEATTKNGTVAQALSQSSDHSNFVGAVKAAGLDATMAGSQPYTVFAPSNAAFQKLPPGAAQNLMQPAQKGQLTAVVTNHLVPGVVTAEDLTRAIERGKGKAQIATLGGGTLTATESGGAITVSDGKGGQARVTPGNQAQSNGVVHTIDTVLMPS